jgi:quercetin dioxygenase-like cupin family protein
MGAAREARLSFLGRSPPPGFALDVITIEPGATRPFVNTDWCDALVVLEQGEVALEAESGRVWHFVPGDVVWLSGLPLRALHNHGDEAVVLSAVRRRAAPAAPCAPRDPARP